MPHKVDELNYTGKKDCFVRWRTIRLRKFKINMMKKIILIIQLAGVFLRWFYNDLIENLQDIKTRYYFETDEKAKKIFNDLDNL